MVLATQQTVTGDLAALARRTTLTALFPPGHWGYGRRSRTRVADPARHESSKGREGGDGKKPRSSSADRRSQGCGAGAEVRPGRHPGPAAPQTPRSGLGTETQGRAKQEVPPPRRRHPRRGRRPRPEAVRGRRRAARGGSCGRQPRERRARAAPREASGGRQDPQRQKERTVRGRHLLQGARVRRAVEREAALPRLLPTQPLRGFPPASRLCARPRSSHTFFLSEDSGDGPGATAACLRALPCRLESLEVAALRRPWGLRPRVRSRRGLPGGNGPMVLPTTDYSTVPPHSKNVFLRLYPYDLMETWKAL
nr:uncharacterized protein LOC112584414 [Bubalus bubalis]